jgi:hypothetical protein
MTKPTDAATLFLASRGFDSKGRSKRSQKRKARAAKKARAKKAIRRRRQQLGL